MSTKRFIPGLLATSGSIFALMSWLNIALWPGYAIWVGWIFLAMGERWRGERWFWLGSVIWNLLVPLLFLLPIVGWTLRDQTPLFLYAIIHSTVAVLLSAYSWYQANAVSPPVKSEATAGWH